MLRINNGKMWAMEAFVPLVWAFTALVGGVNVSYIPPPQPAARSGNYEQNSTNHQQHHGSVTPEPF
jgi:hypothetical protein